MAPYRVDARRCVSYLTIEWDGPIPHDLRPAVGQRIYGCDDCQLVCPWNKWAQAATVADFQPRHGLQHLSLLQAGAWDEAQWLHLSEGSAMRRIGFERFQRNWAVAAGNALRASPEGDHSRALRAQLTARRSGASALLAEHLDWALAQAPHS